MTTYIFGSEQADLSRGPDRGAPDARAIMTSIKAATCGRCRHRRATVARGLAGQLEFRCSSCAADEARVERLRRVTVT